MPHKKSKEDTVQRFDNDHTNVEEHLAKNIYFEMSHAQPWGKESLEHAIKMMGADHIIFGSSYPVRREWLTDGAAFIQSLDIEENEKSLILAGNAQRLYQISG